MQPAFELRHIDRKFRQGDAEIRALAGVSLTVEEGEWLAIAGPSGSGKSTLLSILSFLDTDYQGELRFRGQSTRHWDSSQHARLRLAHIGLVFQRFHLLSALDVLDNVALPCWRLTGDQRLARARATMLLERFGLASRLRHPVARLSGGEMQRVALARALVNDPDILLADEPTGQLSGEDARTIVGLLHEIHRAGKTVILVSHDQGLIRASDRVLQIRHGQTVADDLAIGDDAGTSSTSSTA